MQKKPAFNTSKPHFNAQGSGSPTPAVEAHLGYPTASIWAKFV